MTITTTALEPRPPGRGATLQRTTFTTSRALEYFTAAELQKQIGFEAPWWPVALLKELIDNALDAAENADTAPEIEVTVEPNAFAVRDNGNGLSVDTLRKSLDYTVRVSDKSAVVSPTRGQQGCALKTIWAAPFVADGEHGQVQVTTGGTTYTVDVSLDRIRQEPHLDLTTAPDGLVKRGTLVRVRWPEVASFLDGSKAAGNYMPAMTAAVLVERYALLNPHATIRLSSPGSEPVEFKATAPTWRKWRPDKPTSAYWYYATDALRSLVAAHLKVEAEGGRALTVREFVSQFAGLAGSAKQKQVTDAAGLTGAYLHDLVDSGDVSTRKLDLLHGCMIGVTERISPTALGVLGREHLRSWLTRVCGVGDDSFRYRKTIIDVAGEACLPYVLEVAAGILPGNKHRHVVVGINFSPCLRAPFAELYNAIGEAMVDADDPVIVAVHLACPRVAHLDHGKTTIELPADVRQALREHVAAVCEPWTKIKRREIRDGNRERRLEAQRDKPTGTATDNAHDVMAAAYLEASNNGTLPADARMMMYAARRMILRTDGKLWQNSATFTQKILPKFIEDNPDLTGTWDVVWDARGHAREPHTAELIGLGGLEVRQYLRGWEDRAPEWETPELDTDYPTMGPTNRYQAALFTEKEGFDHILRAVHLQERYDIMLMSTKGMSVVAARQLVDKLSAADVRTFVLHDFDKSGLSILHTLRTDTPRFKFSHKPKVIDLGLRLKDVRRLKLESERVVYGEKDPRGNLKDNGATKGEIDFLVRGQMRVDGKDVWWGERCELNALLGGARAFVEFVETQLESHGVHKVIPDADVLADAYKRAWRTAKLQRVLEDADRDLADEADGLDIPEDIAEQITKALGADPEQPWDAALADIAREAADAEDKSAEEIETP